MATTTPRTWNDDGVHTPRLEEGVIDQILESYRMALGDEDKASDTESGAFYQGLREAFENVLDLLHPAHPDNAFAVVLGGSEDPIAFLPYPEVNATQTFLSVRAGQQDLIGVDITNYSGSRQIAVGHWIDGEWTEYQTWSPFEHEPLHGIEDPQIATHADRIRADVRAAKQS